MPIVTATQASRRFGKVLDAAQKDSVFISRNGEQAAVLLSLDALRRIIGSDKPSGVRPIVKKLLAASVERHGDVYRALAKLD